MKHILLLSAALCFATQATHAVCSVPKPSGLHSTATTSCNITMAWNASSGAAYYIFWYEKVGDTIPVTVNVGTNTSYSVSGLLAKRVYSFKVEAFCSNGTTKGYSKALKVSTLACPIVSSLAVSGINSYSATISWQFPAPCSALSFKLRYRTTSPQSAWVTLQNITTSYRVLTSLAANRQYEVQITSICNGNTSVWSSSVFFQTISSQPKPNILFILEDDGRYDTFQSTGGPSFFHSPAINRIANEGVNFKYMIPATSECSPSRCSFYTGLYPHKHGTMINNDTMISGLATIGQILHDHGYYTGFIGKYGVIGYVDQEGKPIGYDWAATSKSDYMDPTFNVNGNNVHRSDSSHYTQVIQEYALQFLDSVPEGKHFMLFYFTIVPHGPTVPRAQESGMYANNAMPFPTNFSEYTQNYPSYLYGNGTAWVYDSLQTDSMRQNEFEAIKGLDYSVDTLFQYLEEKGILDSTMIIFSSDNGYLKGEHLLKGKEIAYEESIRLPLFIRYPLWFAPGTLISDEIASNIDLAPTLLEAAGIPDTFHMDGVSLHQLATHNVHRKDFMYEFPMGDGLSAIRAVRGLQYKYVKSYCSSTTEEFFNLLTDPKEDTNQIHNASYNSLIQAYRNKLDSLRSAYADITPSNMNCHLENPVYREGGDDVFTASASLVIYPNPTDNSFTISCNEGDDSEKAEAEVYDLLGRIVMKKSWEGDELNMDCSRWLVGSYVVKVKRGEGIYFSKITVER